MRIRVTLRFLFLALCLGLFGIMKPHAQMKIGNNPTRIHPTSILELESPNQALRLTQGDTAEINDVLSTLQGVTDIHDMNDAAVLAAEGLLLYQVSDQSLYMRTGGYWRRMASSDISDSLYVNKGLAIHDSIVIKGLGNALSTDSAVLMLGSNGVVRKIHIDSLLNKQESTVISGGGAKVRLRFGVDAGGNAGPWIDSVSAAEDSVLILNFPSASGAENAAIRGLVDTVTQSFAGSKSFRDSLAIGTAASPNAALDVRGNVNMAATTIADDFDMNIENNATYKTIVCDVSGKGEAASPAITITLPTATEIEGRVYTIKKIGVSGENQIKAFVRIDGTFADGESGTTLYNNWSSVTVQAISDSWHIIGH